MKNKHFNQNCDCSDGCCPPQTKRKLWSRIIFIIIVLAAAAIVTVKLTCTSDAKSDDCCEPVESSNCC